MGAVLARLRTDLRARWASTLVLVLLIGIGGGAVLTSAAGARRTASSYPRMLEEANAGDVLVNPADGNTDFDAIEALPQVVAAGRGTGAFVVPRTPSGEPDFESFNYLPVSSDGRLGYSIERPVNLRGRMPDPDRAEEVFLSTPLAKDMGVDVGDTIPMVALADEATPPEPVDFEVTGVGLFSRDALQEDADATNFLSAPALIFSPAWEQSHPPNLVEGFRASFVQVEPGSLESFLTDAQTTVGDEQLYLQTLPETTSKAQRALRPYVVALAAFALVSGLAVLLVVGQALTRHLMVDANQVPTLSALGLTKGQLVATAVVRAAVVGVAGAAVAVGIAVALSPLMPIGPAGAIEPQPGVDLDGTVLGLGLALIAGLAVLWGVAVGWRARAGNQVLEPRRPRLGEVLARLGLSPVAAAGVRMALERGRGATAAPVGTTLVGAGLGLAALVAALSFGAGLDHLLDEPRLYGWGWDAQVEVSSSVPGEHEDTGTRIMALDSVAASAPGGHGQVQVEGVSVPAVGVGEGDPAVAPPVLEGRTAQRPDEVVLGTTTLRRIGREVGDTVTLAVGSTERRAEVVGRTVFPLFAQYPGADKTGLGVGAGLTVEGLRQLVPTYELTFFLVALVDGADRTRAMADLQGTLPTAAADDPESYQVITRPQRPEDLVGYERVNATPLALAGLLAVLAVGTTAHGLVSATRRRRRDLALLKTLGCTRRQVSAAVAWQATTVGVVALLVGLPLGVAAGRNLWVVLADRLGTEPEPVTPLLAVALAVPATLAVVNLVAALPGRRAGAIRPAVALRAE